MCRHVDNFRFVFAINTISMVKNDALFSYIAPTNIFAWVLMPLRYCMPLSQFVWLNRTIIKVTHFPILFCIYLYERFWLAPSMFEPTDLVDNHSRRRRRAVSFNDPVARTAMFSPNIRMREESVAGYQKDRALEEVFSRMPDSATLRSRRRNERHKTQTAIRHWMDQHEEDIASGQWPTLDSRAVPDWQRRMSVGWDRGSHLRQVSDVRSIASDPAEFLSNHGASFRPGRSHHSRHMRLATEYKDHTDADGDDELVTNDEDEEDAGTNLEYSFVEEKSGMQPKEDYFEGAVHTASKKGTPPSGSSALPAAPTPRPATARRSMHNRTLSTNTILFNPEEEAPQASTSPVLPPKPPPPKKSVIAEKLSASSAQPISGRRSPPRKPMLAVEAKPHPVMPPRGLTETGGVSRTALLSIEPLNRPKGNRRLSSADLSAMSDNTNLAFAGADPNLTLAGSFQTQMAMAMMRDNRLRGVGGVDAADRDRMGRLVLARMKTLEESFAEVIKEMRDMKTSTPPSRWNSSGEELKSRGSTAHGEEDSEVDLRKKKSSSSRGNVTPKKAWSKRPASRRSMKEGKVGLGKGKEPAGRRLEAANASDEGNEEDVEDITKRGSSL